MKVSTVGRADIRQREGEVLHTYLDSVKVPTCCVGHTGRMSPPTPKMGQTFTKEQSDAFLATDLAPVEAVIGNAVKVPISQNEFDAMASLGFNIGAGGLKGSTVIKKLNLGDVRGAAAAFMNWSKPAVLIGRRKAEMAQFLQPDVQVSAVRAQVLSTKAAATKAQAVSTNAGAGALAIGGIATVPVAVAHSHHVGLILVVGGLLLVAATIAALVAAARHATAQILATSADHQAAVGAGLDAASTDPVESLKQ